MSSARDETIEALGEVLRYVEERYADQRATLRDLDVKVGLRLAIYSAIGGLVSLGLPALGRLDGPLLLVVGTLTVVVLFACALLFTFCLSLRVISVEVDMPGLPLAVIEPTLQLEALDLAQLRRDLIRSHAKALEGNASVRASRVPVEKSLRRLSQATAVLGIMAALLGGAVAFLSARQGVQPQTEVSVADDKRASKPSAPPSNPASTPAAPPPPSAPAPAAEPESSAAPAKTQPSWSFPAERVELGEPPTRVQRGPAMPLPTQPPVKKDD